EKQQQDHLPTAGRRSYSFEKTLHHKRRLSFLVSRSSFRSPPSKCAVPFRVALLGRTRNDQRETRNVRLCQAANELQKRLKPEHRSGGPPSRGTDSRPRSPTVVGHVCIEQYFLARVQFSLAQPGICCELEFLPAV